MIGLATDSKLFCLVVRCGRGVSLPFPTRATRVITTHQHWLRLIIIMVATTARTCFLLSATIVGLVLFLQGTKDGGKKDLS